MARAFTSSSPASRRRLRVTAARGGPLAFDPGDTVPGIELGHRFGRRGRDRFGEQSSAPPSLTRVDIMHRRAAAITALAQLSVMRTIRPSMTEGDITRIIDASMAASNASGVCFPHIVGAGPHSTDIHYAGSSRVLKEGDVVVVDIGAAYDGWCADITRTYPVSGRFTGRQRQLYDLVLDAQQAAADYIVPGRTSMNELTSFVHAYFRQSPLHARDTSGRLRSMEHFFIHRAGHYLGREVHPPADYARPIPPGQVFTIEPGLYIESEGIGIRIEDDFLLTEDGPWNLWYPLPSTATAVEALISAGRVRSAR